MVRRGVLTLLGPVVLSVAGGCGGGGGGAGHGGTPLAIVTATLPSAGVDAPYDVAVEARGGDGTYEWTLLAGSVLPSGMEFSADGRLEGTPTALGAYVLNVEVKDGGQPPASDAATLTLNVSPFSVSVSLLRWGDAWTGERYPVSTTGGGTSVTFEMAVNQSGGALVGADPVAGTAVYVPGALGGTDVVRARNAAGDLGDATVRVVPHPYARMTARFGATDVWHVRFSGRKDPGHPYASDFDAALASAGLRAPASVDVDGAEADQIARACVRRATLSWLNVFYGNSADGSAAPGGLEISFPHDAPPAPAYRAPPDGDVVDAEPNQYNVISVLAGDTAGVIGTAYLDDEANWSQENDTTASGTGALGVFCDEIVHYVNSAYSNDTLPTAPVGAADVPALKAILYGTASPGGRYAEIRRIVEGVARSLAATAAHEVGHSLGLEHTSPSAPGSIMNAAAVLSPGATYAFTSADRSALEGALPGPGRGTGALHVARTAAQRAAADVATTVVCGCCRTTGGD